jgi:hypothetical protein
MVGVISCVDLATSVMGIAFLQAIIWLLWITGESLDD